MGSAFARIVFRTVYALPFRFISAIRPRTPLWRRLSLTSSWLRQHVRLFLRQFTCDAAVRPAAVRPLRLPFFQVPSTETQTLSSTCRQTTALPHPKGLAQRAGGEVK
jgi:hypothetical protein